MSEFKDSVKKQEVREHGWLPAVEKRLEIIRKEEPEAFIRYLCLPGRDLTDVKLLQGHGLIDLDKVVACEIEPRHYYDMLTYFSRGENVYLGEIETLILNGTLNEHFPFDVINFDWCGQCFKARKGSYSRKIEAIERTIGLQGEKNTSFHLFLTFMGARDDRRGQKIINEILSEYKDIEGHIKGELGKDDWEEIMNQKHYEKLLQIIPLIVVHLGFKYFFDTRCLNKYTYVGHRARMIKFIFSFNYVSVSDYDISGVRKIAELCEKRIWEAFQLEAQRL